MSKNVWGREKNARRTTIGGFSDRSLNYVRHTGQALGHDDEGLYREEFVAGKGSIHSLELSIGKPDLRKLEKKWRFFQ